MNFNRIIQYMYVKYNTGQLNISRNINGNTRRKKYGEFTCQNEPTIRIEVYLKAQSILV